MCADEASRTRIFQSLQSRAPRAPPWAFTLHRGCSHHPHNVSAHTLSSHRGIGILAQSPRRDQRAGGRRTRRTPPHPSQHTGYERGTAPVPVVSPPPPVHPLSTIIAAAAPVEGGDVGFPIRFGVFSYTIRIPCILHVSSMYPACISMCPVHIHQDTSRYNKIHCI